jgi:hypothetical protein
MTTEQEIIHGGKMCEQFDILKGSGDTAFGGLVRFLSHHFHALKPDTALGRSVYSGYAIKNSGFPRSVWADDRKNGAIIHVHGHTTESGQATKRNAQVIYRQNGHTLLEKPLIPGNSNSFFLSK